MAEIEFLPLRDITEVHLRGLVENSVAESQTLDFKEAAVGTSDAEKREFLKDVTALANTAGGLLIYGILEKESVAEDLVGLAISSIDDEVLRLQNILLSSVEPRMAGVQIHEVALASGGYVLLVKVPQSWRPPHRVTHSNTNRFYLRHSKGVFEPDTEGLRQVFNGGLDQERQLEAWRDERLRRLRTGQQGLMIEGNGVVIVQVASLARGQAAFQIPPAHKCSLDFLPPLIASSTHRWNFDGLLLYPPTKGTTVKAYTQIFPSWRVETVRAGFIEPINNQATLRHSLIVQTIFLATNRSMLGMMKHGGVGPFAVMVTISGLTGSVIQNSDYGVQVDRDILRFPILIVAGDVTGNTLQRQLLPVWDGLWQAYDNENCQEVRDAQGKWKGIPQGWL